VRQERVDELGRQPPSPQLAQEHHEQGRGVGRAVVDLPAAQRQRRRAAEAHLVQDLPGLLVGHRVDLRPLEARQRLQHAQRQIGIDQQCHPRRDQ
jgi:hypothetical protein